MSRHRYLYADSNPVTFVDPSGFISLTELSVTLGILGILSTIGIASVTSFNLANSTPSFDGVQVSLRASASALSLTIQGGWDFIYDRNNGRAWLGKSIEGGFDVFAMPRTRTPHLSAAAGFGVISQMTSPNDLGSFTFTSFLPISPATITIAARVFGPKSLLGTVRGFLTRASQAKLGKIASIGLGFTTGGAELVEVFPKNALFGATVTYTPYFTPSTELPEPLRSAIQPVEEFLRIAFGTHHDPVNQFDALIDLLSLDFTFP